MSTVSIQNLTRSRLAGPRSAFQDVAEGVLPGWEISLVFVSPARAKALNVQLRSKTYTPNVLSYVVGEKSGEIIICPRVVKKEAPARELSLRDYTLFLFIHGVLHIKGWPHGAKMEACEEKLMARFATRGLRSYTHGTTNSNRHRHRDVPSKDGRRRGTLR